MSEKRQETMKEVEVSLGRLEEVENERTPDD